MDKRIKLGSKILGATALVLSAPLMIVSACGRSLLYHPTHVNVDQIAARGWHAERVAVEDDIDVVGLVRPATARDARWVLFFGGNAMPIDSSRSVLSQVGRGETWGLAVYAYRGYDGSDGSPSQDALTRDAEVTVSHLQRTYGVEPGQLVLVGQSLGTGVASHLAATLEQAGTPPAGLVLLSPYSSMSQVFDDQVPLLPVGWMTPDKYRTDELVADLPPPILLIHGEDDNLITIDHSERLLASLGDKAELIRLPNRGHNDLWSDPITASTIRDFVRR